ncbi:MAG: hypothetical protein HKN82_06215 [Akkermansiaceae bacterium]|nr:hypothetical protein [Akkermansiaceae bacterium]NNM30774.1 hypothetical protein [Akkermansiaceae bacterium]
MKSPILLSAVLAWALAAAPHLPAAPDDPPADPDPPAAKAAKRAGAVRSMTFGWPFLDPEKMKVRGGTTAGAEVTLATEPAEAWTRLQETDLSPMEKDRRAILAMAGSYRVSFQFIETMGFTEGYHPSRPYFSWGTEEVRVLEDKERFISLQHTLVMYFKDKDGNESEPMVMKHWRQDWRYEDADLHTYRGNNRWRRAMLPRRTVEGRWTQTVYQVDDSPRYEALGTWKHTHGMSTWASVLSWRPLPRREFSVRDDYNVLECAHTITITPDGWVHTQNNRKLSVHAGMETSCLAREFGINRYERITAPDLTAPADEYYASTGAYWGHVRETWANIYRKYEQFQLRSSYDDRKLYEHHFGYAAELMQGGKKPKIPPRKHARETINAFLVIPGRENRKAPGSQASPSP